VNSQRGMQVFRRLRWTVLALFFVLLYYFVFDRYAYERIDTESAIAMSGTMQLGERHLLDTQPSEELMREWVVAFVTPQQQVAWSRVRGVPGDRLERSDSGWRLVDGEGIAHGLPRDAEFAERMDGQRLQDGQYLLLNDLLTAPYPDSRFLGPIARENIHYRMVFHF
jgi:hypothetical protein